MGMEIINPGPLTTVQDLGRFGYMNVGIGTSGVMDRQAYKIANELVGNTDGEAVLEATLMGPEIEFTSDAVIAVTGADMKPAIDGYSIGNYKAVKIVRGQRLKLGMAVSGCRAYIAVRGGIDVEKVMGSRSTNLKCGIGGFEGRNLRIGDLLKIGVSTELSNSELEKLNSKNYRGLEWNGNMTVRVIEGPQGDYFTEEGLKNFYSMEYKISPESDRMGIRLSGAKVESYNGTDIVSDGIAFGSVQIPSSGQPIVLMADHQTTGGYAKVATVVSEDLSLLAQARPGDLVHFEKVDIGDIQKRKSFFGRLFKW